MLAADPSMRRPPENLEEHQKHLLLAHKPSSPSDQCSETELIAASPASTLLHATQRISGSKTPPESL